MTLATSELSYYLSLLSWSPERLAREINKQFGEGTISHKAPYNWLKGACPRGQLPHKVAAILSEHLGEVVPVKALWPARFAASPHSKRVAPPAQRPVPEPRTTAEASGRALKMSVDWLVDMGDGPPTSDRGKDLPLVALEMLASRVRHLRQLDETTNNRLVLDWTLQDIKWARQLSTERTYAADKGAELHRIIAELGQLAGWLAADLGMERRSQSCFMVALRAAHAARDRSLGAYIISCMSYRAQWRGQAEEALRLIGIARMGAGDECAGIEQALLATRQARAYAILGDVSACHRTLDEAAELSLADGGSAGAPWGYWLNPAVMVADAGRAWLELGQVKRAELHLVRGIGMLGSSQPRNRMLHWASLAEARLGQDELDGAAAAAIEALDLAGRIASARAVVRLARLREDFSRYDSQVASRLTGRIDELLHAQHPRAAGPDYWETPPPDVDPPGRAEAEICDAAL